MSSTPHLNAITKPHWTTAADTLQALVNAKRFGFFADFDGTLCRFTLFPDRPAPSPGIIQALVTLSEKLPLVSIISGRAAPELRDFLDLPNILYVGNHGLEFLREEGLVVVDEAKIWEERLTAFVRDLGEPSIPTVRYQPKRITMSITYGRTENPALARERLHAILQRANEPYGFILSEGHTLWEVKPPIAHNKGTALTALVKEFDLDAAIFLGDDHTDIPALEAIGDLRATRQIAAGLSVAVRGAIGVQPVIAASDVIAEDVTDVEHLLTYLLERL